MSQSDRQTDEALALAAQSGDMAAADSLVIRYEPLVRGKAHAYFSGTGSVTDLEDFVQEGMIGLLKAIRQFNPDKNASFRTFASLCISTSICSAYRLAVQQKKLPRGAVELDDSEMEGVKDEAPTPEEMLLRREESSMISDQIFSGLSPFETEVARMYLSGSSYREIAGRLSRPVKSIDNAIQRIRSKLKGSVR